MDRDVRITNQIAYKKRYFSCSVGLVYLEFGYRPQTSHLKGWHILGVKGW